MFTSDTVETIVHDYKGFFKEYNVREMVDVLSRLIDYPVNEESLEGIQNNYNRCIRIINEVGNSDEEIDMAVKLFFNMEPLMKKILYIYDRNKFIEKKKKKELTLGKILDEMGVLEIVRTIKTEDGMKLDLNTNEKRLLKIQSKDEYAYHILRAYDLRNKEAHEMRNWRKSEKYEHIDDVMISVLFISWKYRNEINEAYEKKEVEDQGSISDYLLNIKNSYEKSKNAGFVFVPINWSVGLHQSYGDKKNDEISIDVLAKQDNIGKHIMLLGGAGCGKSTSIDYVEYTLAKARLNNNSLPIPVKICLGSVNEKWVSIEEFICQKLNLTYQIVERLLSKGSISLLLDGVNEMISSDEIKIRLVKEIETVLAKYKSSFVLISDRENVEIKISADMELFYLHRMGRDDIEKYIRSKPLSNEKKDAIIDYASNMLNVDVKFTPIILNYLVQRADDDCSLPEDELDLYLGYIRFVLKREYNEKKDINAAPGRLDLLLEYLAVAMKENYSVNMVYIMKVFTRCTNELGMERVDSKRCLDLSLQLGILERDEDGVRFANERFFDCLFAEGIDAEMGDWND